MALHNKLNRMAWGFQTMESFLPKALHSFGYTFVFNRLVKLAGTSGVKIEALSRSKSTVYLKNRRRIQNHIGGLHACSMALAAETATGLLVGMNVPDSHVPLIKHMNVDYVRRCEGNIRATATLSEVDRIRMYEEEKGDVRIDCRVVDESGEEPIRAEMIWAWIPKHREDDKEKDKKKQDEDEEKNPQK